MKTKMLNWFCVAWISLGISMFLVTSCTKPKYEKISQEVIDGKVSAVKDGHRGRISTLPRIWVQTPTATKEVEIPFEYEDRWKVGDDCLLIIIHYKENEN